MGDGQAMDISTSRDNVVQPVLKRLHSPDTFDLESFHPDEPDYFCVLVQAMFGTATVPGEESFDILVCSPKWLASEVEREGVVVGRHYLIVASFDFERIRAFLGRYADECVGATWDEVAAKLGRLGRWEFEDYTG